MQNIKIQRITVKKEAIGVQFHYEETRQGITNFIHANKNFKFQMHDDLSNALDSLKVHFGLLTCTISQKEDSLEITSESPILEELEIKKVKITDKGTVKGVYIEAQRTLEDGRVFNVQTPFCNFDPDVNDYQFLEELESDIETVISEIIQFINGKIGMEGTQLGVFDKPETNLEPSKSGRRKKVA